MPRKRISRGCRIFNCDRRHGNYCCADCGYKRTEKCPNPCQNDPLKCGYACAAVGKKETSASKRR